MREAVVSPEPHARSRPPLAPFDPLFFDRDPLFWPIAPSARAFASCAGWPAVDEYGARLPPRAPVQFRLQPAKPRGRRRGEVCARDLYDGRIVEEGWVPTRAASWHDFLNMLVWSVFPAAKWQLHARQHRAQTARIDAAASARASSALSAAPSAASSEAPISPLRALPNARTREQDSLALLDEGGVLIACRDDSLAAAREALSERRTGPARALFATGAARAILFGHALYEGLVLHHPDGWGAGHLFAAGPSLDSDSASLLRAADTALAAALAAPGTFQSTADLVRVDLALLRD